MYNQPCIATCLKVAPKNQIPTPQQYVGDRYYHKHTTKKQEPKPKIQLQDTATFLLPQ